MKLSFIFRESYRLILKSKFLFAITVLLFTTGLIVSSLILAAYKVSFNVESETRETFKFNIFLSDSITVQQIDSIKSEIKSFDRSAKFELISKEEALRKFKTETGEEISSVLEYNPLPSTLVTTLNNASASGRSFEVLKNSISGFPGVEDYEFERDLLVSTLGYIHRFRETALWATGTVLFFVLMLIFGSLHTLVKINHKMFETVFVFSGNIKTLYLIFITYWFHIFIISLISILIVLTIAQRFVLDRIKISLLPLLNSQEAMRALGILTLILILVPAIYGVLEIRKKLTAKIAS